MRHSAAHPRRSRLRAHLALGLLLLLGGVIATLWPAVRSAVWVAGTGMVATHVGLALLALLGIRLVVRAHAAPGDPASPGQVIRWAGLYDVLVSALTFGRERAFRDAILAQARLASGERVLDVGCGTGTLALAAKRRVGAAGTVRGVDAGEEMVARARRKAAREAVEVAFDVATAQALPFPDASFDVVLCTLVVHHLPEGARHQAVAEMRRVLRPGGRLLVVDLMPAAGLLAALNPVNLVHGREAMRAAEEATVLMRNAGFTDIATGSLGARVYGYAAGIRPPD